MQIVALFSTRRSTSTFDTPARAPTGSSRLRRAVWVSAGALIFAGLATSASAGPREVGVWFDDTRQGAVEIFQCGSNLCGRIVWLKDPLDENGTPLTDGYNPKPSNRERPICGLQVLGGLARQPDGSLDGGWVYDPKVGQSYDAAIELAGRNLTLIGYKGIRMFSKSFTWTKAPPSLPKCNKAQSATR
ncbi:MAG: DUF2147 domain-containing protein [Hyphomicrobiaceae bacterium]